MGAEEQYRQHAVEALALAQSAGSTERKSRLLLMAKAWLDLADRIRGRKPKSRNQQVHVIPVKKLGDEAR
jgi:hypothetical protein